MAACLHQLWTNRTSFLLSPVKTSLCQYMAACLPPAVNKQNQLSPVKTSLCQYMAACLPPLWTNRTSFHQWRLASVSDMTAYLPSAVNKQNQLSPVKTSLCQYMAACLPPLVNKQNQLSPVKTTVSACLPPLVNKQNSPVKTSLCQSHDCLSSINCEQTEPAFCFHQWRLASVSHMAACLHQLWTNRTSFLLSPVKTSLYQYMAACLHQLWTNRTSFHQWRQASVSHMAACLHQLWTNRTSFLLSPVKTSLCQSHGCRSSINCEQTEPAFTSEDKPLSVTWLPVFINCEQTEPAFCFHQWRLASVSHMAAGLPSTVNKQNQLSPVKTSLCQSHGCLSSINCEQTEPAFCFHQWRLVSVSHMTACLPSAVNKQNQLSPVKTSLCQYMAACLHQLWTNRTSFLLSPVKTSLCQSHGCRSSINCEQTEPAFTSED